MIMWLWLSKNKVWFLCFQEMCILFFWVAIMHLRHYYLLYIHLILNKWNSCVPPLIFSLCHGASPLESGFLGPVLIPLKGLLLKEQAWPCLRLSSHFTSPPLPISQTSTMRCLLSHPHQHPMPCLWTPNSKQGKSLLFQKTSAPVYLSNKEK